jgi:ABC-type nitrate/sulfonate/bicarbonate transport system permease component
MISDGSLIKHTLASLQRVLIGFILAFLLAMPFGLFMGMSVTFRKAFDPLVELLRPIPPIAIIPISILWFGIGETSKIFIITYASFFPIALNVMGGVHGVESLHLKAAQTLGANRLQTFYYVTLRSAIPNIVIGLRSGLSMAFISLVAAELIASDAGLGFLIQDARYVFRTDQMLVGMITIGVVGFIINKIVLELEKLVVRWK